MTPYAEQAEQARAEEDSLAWHIAECLSGDVDCAVEQAKRVEILKRIPLLDTLARVEAVVNKEVSFHDCPRKNCDRFAWTEGHHDMRDELRKALEGE